ncbi:hypothetical protein NLI96_g4085 [Meripilus lineatus]|uniref:Uncharacterized protein n=1 Tax=Meripilus lineatus TaxID=2056292 RepID=A0AAD5VAY1_9APHY|nr:hypothetical protein NLI96_g4085 [Physisporinus lineatus]
MGGNAFNLLHPNAKFPRIQPVVYNQLKENYHEILLGLYYNVATPHEAPEKLDHGDIDFIVHGPRRPVAHQDLERAFRSKWCIPPKGIKGTGNFAIPLSLNPETNNTTEDTYCQVDVHVCEDEADFHRVVFFHSYGDLGMILGLMARAVGLSLGPSGLKLAKPLSTHPAITFFLSSSFEEIMAFFGLSLETWKQGFGSQREIFDWVSTSPYFDAGRMVRSDANNGSRRKVREVRSMYRNFLVYADGIASKQSDGLARQAVDGAVEQTAINFFGKRELYEQLLRVSSAKGRIKAVFSGKLVVQWTGIEGLPVRWLMDEVQRRLGGDGAASMHGPSTVTDSRANTSIDSAPPHEVLQYSESCISSIHLELAPWERALEKMSPGDVQALVTQVKEEMKDKGLLECDWRAAKGLREERKVPG